MPHCLIAGTTGSGKSVCINTIIMSIMYLQRPDRVKLILFDPKVVEMAPFKDIPHLMCPIINETGAPPACSNGRRRRWTSATSSSPSRRAEHQGVQRALDRGADRALRARDAGEEAKIPKKLPYMVIIIDELADLMMTAARKSNRTSCDWRRRRERSAST
jgi:S-DNA-T family DNA segregation ATPase FtsK/SpoIIIE